MSEAPETRPPRGDITCDGCSAACCRSGVQIILTTKEAFTHALRMRRRVEAPAQPLPRDVIFRNEASGRFFVREVAANCEISTLTADCGYLDADNRCTIHENASYPASCGSLTPGSEACLYERARAGIHDE